MASAIRNPLAMQKVFLYAGQNRPVIPSDVTRVRVHPSLTTIPRSAFRNLSKLEEVELCEGVEEIGEWTFHGCVSLRRIKIALPLLRGFAIMRFTIAKSWKR
ncbi:hypothetical protein ACHAXR_005584 [Thalassiosira sp. AJA248-18]